MTAFVVLAFCLLFPLMLLLVVPFGFALTSFSNLITLPIQMVAVAFDGARRRNHALEHATVNVLEQRYRRRLMASGFAEADGFFINGVGPDPRVVLDAAQEALRRLQAGETELAIHSRCGTVIVAGQLVSAVTFFVVLFYLKLSFPGLILAMLAAIFLGRLLAPPLGRFLQRTLTTSTDLEGMIIDRIEPIAPSSMMQVLLTGGQAALRYRLWTQQVKVERLPDGRKRWKAY